MKSTCYPYCRWCGVVLWLLMAVGCSVPQRFWPQKDIPGSRGISGPAAQTVLIASRSSEYKVQLVAELQKQLADTRIPHEITGIEELAEVDASRYAAVVVINTCLAWGFDHEVRTFLGNQTATANIIVLTTSGKGDWLPKRQEQDFDAISGASIKSNIGSVVQDLMERIRGRIAWPVKKPAPDVP